RKECPHRLPHEIGRGHAGDAEPVRELGCNRGLPGSGGAADEDHDRQVELPELLVAAEALDRLAPLLLAEHLDGERLEALQLDLAASPLEQLVPDPARERVRTVACDSGGHQRARHQPARVGKPELSPAERERHDPPRLVHARLRSGTSESTRSSSSSETTSLAAKTTSAPRASAASATTST